MEEFNYLSKVIEKDFYRGCWEKDKIIAVIRIGDLVSFGVEVFLQEIQPLADSIACKSS